MSLFKSKKSKIAPVGLPVTNANYSTLAEMTLNSITDGVLLVDEHGMIKFANPAAARMVGYGSPENVIGLIYDMVLRLENSEGMPVAKEENQLIQAFDAAKEFTNREYMLISAQSDRRAAIALTLIPTGGVHDDRIITFRDITKELKDEQEKSEFISTASHEMRTPVASIEGYLALALNPQTATIDARAHQYLEAAHKASKHLGDLFRDLLDVTKLDDDRVKMHLVPVDIVATVREIADARAKDMQAKHLKYSFGTNAPTNNAKQLNQLVYASVDLSFLQEILDNLIDNAIKYTPDGGEIWVNARGDGDKVVINVTDTGIGVSPDDAAHIFQKFYRVDNSQTRQIGGTGLGLYLVKQRAEAMNGRVWVESSFGDGSTFFVSLPRLSDTDYQRQKIVYDNEQAVQAFAEGRGAATNQAPVAPVATPNQAPVAPVATPNQAPVAPVATPNQAPVAPVATPNQAPVAPVATPNQAPVAPVATPNQAPVAPVATPNQAPVAPVATPNQAPVAPVATPNLNANPQTVVQSEAMVQNGTTNVSAGSTDGAAPAAGVTIPQSAMVTAATPESAQNPNPALAAVPQEAAPTSVPAPNLDTSIAPVTQIAEQPPIQSGNVVNN